MLKTVLITLVVLIIGVIAAWSLWIRSLGQPNYSIVSKTDQYELRRYDAYLVAETSVSGHFEDSGNRAFRALAGYIFGRNTTDHEMAMTAPVVSTQETSQSAEKMAMTAPVFSSTVEGPDDGTSGTPLWRYQFVMERKYTLDTLPQPLDPSVVLKQVPERLIAARRFSGRWSADRFAEQETTLLKALRDDGVRHTGVVSLARYDDPFTLPFLRRNEVLIEIIDDSNGLALTQ